MNYRLHCELSRDAVLPGHKVSYRVQSGRRNGEKVSGVLCDRRMDVKIKGKGLQDDSKTSSGVRSGYMGGEEDA